MSDNKIPDMPENEKLEIAIKYDEVVDSFVGYIWHQIDAENYHTLAAAYREIKDEWEGYEKRFIEMMDERDKLQNRLDEGRDYLMQVPQDKITVSDTLIAFGWDGNGLEERP
jgi:chemotaxis regulatin CheY-phosphate phosphatase CheZ